MIETESCSFSLLEKYIFVNVRKAHILGNMIHYFKKFIYVRKVQVKKGKILRLFFQINERKYRPNSVLVSKVSQIDKKKVLSH